MNSKEHRKEDFLQLLEKNLGVISPTCRQLNMERQTYYNWIKKDSEFAQKCKEIQEVAVDFVESKLFENIANGDTTSIIFFLKTKAKHRGYNEKSTLNIEADKEIKIEIVK